MRQFRLPVLCGVLLLGGTCGGCASFYAAPDRCAAAFARCPLATVLSHPLPCEHCTGCDDCVAGGRCEDQVCANSSWCPLVASRDRCRIEVGPPAVRYRPPMPPEFLPVPVRPVFSQVNMQPTDQRVGTVEVGYEPQWSVEGGNHP